MTTVPGGAREPHPWDEEEHDEDEAPPPMPVSRRTLVAIGLTVAVLVALVAVVLPQLDGLGSTYDRVSDGDPWWLALALLFSVLSFGG